MIHHLYSALYLPPIAKSCVTVYLTPFTLSYPPPFPPLTTILLLGSFSPFHPRHRSLRLGPRATGTERRNLVGWKVGSHCVPPPAHLWVRQQDVEVVRGPRGSSLHRGGQALRLGRRRAPGGLPRPPAPEPPPRETCSPLRPSASLPLSDARSHPCLANLSPTGRRSNSERSHSTRSLKTPASTPPHSVPAAHRCAGASVSARGRLARESVRKRAWGVCERVGGGERAWALECVRT